MQLFSSPTSPFVRKIRVLIREKGATDKVRETVVAALSDPAELHAANPLGQVPALLLDNGRQIINSPLICQFLDEELGGHKLIPPFGEPHWDDMRLQTIGDGIAEAAVSLSFEGMRPEEQRSPVWTGRWQRAVSRSLDLLEEEAAGLEGDLTLGRIAVACALGYLDFRHDYLGWRNGRPTLTAWYEKISGRPAFKETAPA
ncbi:MAG: glutathione S-transferase N-terminal domain-containing protein [Parvibaculum sp.]|nr:glutathione S-transferase N-terminal domain-containing protein [Parvibaculum sp.]